MHESSNCSARRPCPLGRLLWGARPGYDPATGKVRPLACTFCPSASQSEGCIVASGSMSAFCNACCLMHSRLTAPLCGDARTARDAASGQREWMCMRQAYLVAASCGRCAAHVLFGIKARVPVPESALCLAMQAASTALLSFFPRIRHTRPAIPADMLQSCIWHPCRMLMSPSHSAGTQPRQQACSCDPGSPARATPPSCSTGRATAWRWCMSGRRMRMTRSWTWPPASSWTVRIVGWEAMSTCGRATPCRCGTCLCVVWTLLVGSAVGNLKLEDATSIVKCWQ